MPHPAPTSTSNASSKSRSPKREAIGASPRGENPEKAPPQGSQTASAATSGTAQSSAPSSRFQTDGAYTPITGPVTSVRQLVRGPNVSKNSIGSFDSMAAYGDYLRTLKPFQLKQHALEEARIVPIDDTARLIRRLEAKWTEISAKEGGRGAGGMAIPQRKPFSAEQLAAQEKVRREMLGGRA